MSVESVSRMPAVLSRRSVLFGAAMLGLLAGCGSARAIGAATPVTPVPEPTAGSAPGGVFAESPADPTTSDTTSAASGSFEVSHTDDEWRRLLTSEQYRILRTAGTEAPFTSDLDDEHGAGVFACAGCALDLFSSETKFDSGTGWPSFWQPLDGAVVEKEDDAFGMTRTEVLCRRCGGHLGHVFTDGPPPTGLRYCLNGAALTFRSTT